ncbi:hypothetical protein [uncultured Clostridium sp.]|uniref:hypothetical protein n=1 Tax=uncultured Clostridium sp. TaxID=59620 RepID=UPI0025E8009F|nr:hypothetical protein [uncultured Clostridium sp.]
MIKGNKKIVSLLTSGILMLATNMAILSSDATITKAEEVKVAEVSLSDVSLRGAVTSKSTKTLSKDFATSNRNTGTITSIGQYVDFSKVIPAGSRVVSVTLYCPTSVKVTQSKYTAINSYIISNGNKQASVKFVKTNSPSSTSKTTALAGEAANTKWLVKIQGNVLMQYTGMDGFTVNGGSKMIIEYK